MIRKPYARLLTGGSTGGWESLALQVYHPDFFGGTWTLYPDPVDFCGVTASPMSTKMKTPFSSQGLLDPFAALIGVRKPYGQPGLTTEDYATTRLF